MAKINILPASVYNRIAAGEVVDRPYSVVKELVENAIDAGAKNIDVLIEQGGKKRIQVTDDGHGIERDDLVSAFLPHATSKIAKAEDLDAILTLGFRGEALASISSVAKVTIVSKTEEGNANRITNEGGAIGEIMECGGAKGTQITVDELFFNTPARQKFLKADKSEESDVTNLLARLILGHPDISFTYYADGRKVCQSFGGGLEEAMSAVYDTKCLKECIRIDAEKHGIRISGYIGNQNYFKANRTYQTTFVNGRYVTNNTIQMAMHNAYGSYAMKRQYPFYVLFITVPTEIVDVNVHPNKADVRFANNQIIYGCLYNVVTSILDGTASALDFVADKPKESVKSTFPEAVSVSAVKEEKTERQFPSVTKSTYGEPERKPRSSPSQTSGIISEPKRVEPAYVFSYEEAKKELELGKPMTGMMAYPFEEVRTTVEVHSPTTNRAPKQEKEKIEKQIKEEEDAFEQNKKFLAELEEKKAKQAKVEIGECTYCGALFQTYLIYERGDDAFLIDQHAAHERLIFDALKEKTENRSVMVQPMLMPYILNTSVSESDFLNAHLEEIRALGFDIDEFGTNTFKVSGVPLDLQDISLDAFFGDILSDITGLRGIKLTELLKDKLAMAACKAAVKGGMRLSDEQVKKLFEMMDGNMGLKCPHGRPVVVRLTKTEIEKMFKRIV